MPRMKDRLDALKGNYRNAKKRKEIIQGNQQKHRDTAIRYQLPVKPRLTEQDIVDYKERMQEVIDYANLRVDAVLLAGTVSTELDSFLQGDPYKRFDISDINDPGELRSYMTMVRTIIPTISESSDKAIIDTAFMSRAAYEGQFGNNWRETYKDEEGRVHYRHFNVHDVIDENGEVIRKAIDPEIASKAFEAYRKLEEEFGGYIGHQGAEGVYGSENLIIAIYDSFVRGEDGQVFGHDLLNAWISQELGHLENVNISLDEATAIITSWDDYIDRRMF